MKKIISNEGILAFYKGTATPLVGVGACVSIQFGTFEFMKRYFRERNEKTGHSNTSLSSGQFYLSGGAAGVANTIIACTLLRLLEVIIRSGRVDTNTAANSVFNGKSLYWPN